MTTAAENLQAALDGGLIVSCQPVTGGPMDNVATIVALALAARDGGARALRIEGAANVAAVARACDLPIVGLVKRDLDTSPVRITPFIEDVAALAEAGAQVIAVDATDRARPVPVEDLLAAIRRHGRIAMADLSNEAEAARAKAMGFDILGTTMSGYTGGPVPAAPDLAFVAACRRLGGIVVAEGRFNTPEAAADARRAGAAAVCVGSAITRTEHVTGWFKAAIDAAGQARDGGSVGTGDAVLAFDIGGTKALAALVRGAEVLDRRVAPTPGAVGSPAWFEGVAALADGWTGRFARIGVAATGLIEDGHWSALNPATLDIPERTALARELGARLGAPVEAVNDAQAAAWGEYRFGAGRGRDMVFVTVSSGIGGGIVAGGRLLRGARGLAGSLGQVQGSAAEPRLESRASGFAIAGAAQGAGRDADTRAVFAAAAAGEAWADQIVTDAARRLAAALVDLQRVVDPECVVLGGGVGLLPAFRAALDRELGPQPERLRPCVVAAELGGDAGIIGVADLAR